MIRFYAPDIESTGMLPEEESQHCCRVLRKREGDRIYVVDGKGAWYECELTDANPRGAQVDIISKHTEEIHQFPHITIAVAPTKNADRMEWFVEKAVEMGVDKIVLLQCDRSERRKYNTDRLNKIAVSAMKQSLKTRLVEVDGLCKFKDFIDSCSDSQKFMGYCDSAYPRKEFMKEYMPENDVTILIGPEGDFSPEEVSYAVNHGFVPVTFGNSRLRTETAAMFSIACAHAKSLM